MASTVLTGIKPTGTPHVGNLLGAIRPALALATTASRRCTSSPTTTRSRPSTTRRSCASSTYEVAATWLAMGLDPEKVDVLSPVRHPRDLRARVGARLLHVEGLDEQGPRLQGDRRRQGSGGRDRRRCRHQHGHLQLSGADGGRHPRVRRRPRAGRQGSGPARRDRARHRAADQPRLRQRRAAPAAGASSRTTRRSCPASTAAR